MCQTWLESNISTYLHIGRETEKTRTEREQEQAQVSMGPEDSMPTGQGRPRHPIAHSRRGLVTQNQESNEFKHLRKDTFFSNEIKYEDCLSKLSMSLLN